MRRGATALNAVTYLDMAVRARPACSAGENSVSKLADLAHVPLDDGESADNRKAGVGSLVGIAECVPAQGRVKQRRGRCGYIQTPVPAESR